MCIPYKKGIMQESHTYYLLSKYMDHTISTEELKTLRLLVNLSDDDELSLSLSLLWENGRPFEEVDERIIRDMFSGIQNRTRKERFVMVFRKLARIAAILLIPLLSVLSGYLYFNPVNQEEGIGNLVVHADRGERSGVTLPDGTQVKLNAESSLSYTHDFGRELRQVNLEGEAYFEVTKDEARCFNVIMEGATIEVMGTSFNASCYPGEGQCWAVLESGKINLRTDHGVAAVNVGECASCDIASGKVTVETVDLKYFTSWRYGTFYFYNTPLSEIVQKLGRWYDVHFKFADESLRDVCFSGAALRSKPIDFMLELLSSTQSLKFDIQSDGMIMIYKK